jgi:transcriptional regulator with XRE-family HTH domain
MTAWSDYTTGERIKILRGTELTQVHLAEMAGVSVALVQKVEQGKRASVASLIKLADALGTDVGVLLGQQAPRRAMSRAERASLQAVSHAVHDTALDTVPTDVAPGNLADLERAKDATWAAYWEGKYAELGVMVPGLIAAAYAFAGAHDGRLKERGLTILADAFKIAAYTANMLGRRDLAYAALANAKRAADQSGDELMASLLMSALSWILLRDGRTHRAVAVAEEAATAIEPSFSKASPQRLSVFGNLMLQAAVAASRQADRVRAGDYLSQAHAAAARLGVDANHYQTAFGPTTARTQAVGIHLALGDVGKALDLIEHTPLPVGMPKVAKSRYMLDVALARCEARQWDRSADTLLDLCAEAPNWVRHQALAGVVVQRLADGSTSKLRKVTQLLGVPLLPH